MAENKTQGTTATRGAIHTFAQDLDQAKSKHRQRHETRTAGAAAATPATVPVTAATPPAPKPVAPPPPPNPHPNAAASQPAKGSQKTPTPTKIPVAPTHSIPAPKGTATESQQKINNATDEIAKHTSKAAPSILSSSQESEVSLDSDIESKGKGVVITDTKRKRFTLGAALAASGISLWEFIKSEYADSKEPKYTVVSAEGRKNIIQTATTKTGRDSISDHDRVVRRVRAKKAQTVSEEESVETDPTHLLEAPDTTPRWSTSVPEARPQIAPSSPKPPTTITEDRETRSVTPSSPSATTAPTPLQSTTQIITPKLPTPPVTAASDKLAIPEQTSVTQPSIETANEHPATTSTKAVLPTKSSAPPPLAQSNPNPDTPQYKTTWLQKIEAKINPTTLLVIGGTVLVIAAVYVPPLLTTDTLPPAEESTAITTSVQQITNSRTETIVLSELPHKLQETMRTQVSGETTEFSIINDIAAQQAHVTLLQQLTNQLPQSFYDTVVTFNIGVHEQHPFMLFDVTEASVAQGTMYQWEATMVKDFAELFQLSRVDTTARDIMIQGKDVRVLMGNDMPILYYGFIERTTLLITTNDTTLEYVMSHRNATD